jgi:hypothetical protein
MNSHMYPTESQYIADCSTSAEAYRTLQRCHEKQSGLTQTQLLQRMMQVHFDMSAAHCDTIMSNLHDIIYRIDRIGHIDSTRLCCLFAIQSLRSTHPSVHKALTPALMDGSISLEAVEKCLHFFFELHASENSDQVAFPAMSPILPQVPLVPLPSTPANSDSSPLIHTIALPASLPPCANICPNCKKPGHSIEFCISPGGKIEGHPASDAIAHQHAARDASCARNSLSNASSNPLVKIDNDGTAWIGGVKYQLAPSEPVKATIAEVEVEAAMTAADQGEYSDWAVNNNSSSWGNNEESLDTASFFLVAPDTLLITRGPGDPPLYLDSRASTHISCVCSDFCELASIESRTITGVGNSSVSAIGIGTVEISIPETSAQLTLRNVLYAPDAGVRLISISQLDDSGHCLDFTDGRCTISDRSSGKTIAECPRNSFHLYVLPGSIKPSIPSASISSTPISPIPIPSISIPSIPSTSIPSIPSTSLSVALPSLSATPNLETWHQRLGHANFCTALDMARSKHVTGMQVNPSHIPQVCDTCIRGKQMHQPVPKTCEGGKATRHPGRVFVDLTGPQTTISRSGCSYIMNIIDDYSSYHWMQLLKAKSEAARELREWLLAVENQLGEKLCYLVTDNGELCSNEMNRWCAEKGITHQFTAPHTSAQNGCIERLHRTLMNKARAMRLSCNAPLHLWDEFILTASCLSTLTTSKVAKGRTPYELWFGTCPSLSHLREIGCHAYVLISDANPKIAARSVECTLIGYASNAKAYRCWFRESGRIVESFHVTFVEHINRQTPELSPSVGMNTAPNTGENVAALPPADGMALLSEPSGMGMDVVPRRSRPKSSASSF